MKSEIITKAIIEQGILPLYFHPDENVSLQVLEAVYHGGIRAVEYTNRGEAAHSNFVAMTALRDRTYPDLKLGVGTIKNMKQADAYLNAGADFLVSPGFVTEVAAYCVENDIFYAPGCMTPTEIIRAENAGLRFIKLFPGNLLGPGFLRGIKEIFPQLFFMPTGGVDPTHESIKSWFDAGVCAVGMGSKLISKKLMEAGDYGTITTEMINVINIIRTIKNTK